MCLHVLLCSLHVLHTCLKLLLHKCMNILSAPRPATKNTVLIAFGFFWFLSFAYTAFQSTSM